VADGLSVTVLDGVLRDHAPINLKKVKLRERVTSNEVAPPHSRPSGGEPLTFDRINLRLWRL